MKKFELHIDSYGSGISVKDGQFLLRNKTNSQSIPVNKVRSITLAKSTSMTGAVVKLALDNEIDISFVEKDGMPYARVWNSKFGSITTIRRNQLHFSSSKDGHDWIKEVISIKIKNQMAIAANVLDKNEGPYIKQFREKLSGYLLKINTATTEDALDLANKLRGWEANASKLYFRCLSYSLPQEFRFSKRSKRPARDPFNATLNYCYGILYNKIEGMMIRAGLDLHIGVFHKDQHNRPVLVFDFIEQYRHWSEYPVIEMFQNKLLSLDHFSEDETTGVSILQPGKKIIIETYFSYMHEKIDYNNSRGKRFWHIQNAIQQFSTKMKEYKPNDIKQSGI